MAAVDWTDPCQKAKALSSAYYDLVSGGKAAKISYLANGAQRSVEYSLTKLDLLQREMQVAQGECAQANGLPNPNRRFAIRGGSSRPSRRPVLTPDRHYLPPSIDVPVPAPSPPIPMPSTQLPFTLTSVMSYTAHHSFTSEPDVRLIEADTGQEIETDTTHTAGAVTVEFATPFTGKLYLSP